MGIAKWTEEIRENYFERMDARRASGLPAASTLPMVPRIKGDVQRLKRKVQYLCDVVKCKDCGGMFVLSTEEKAFYNGKGLENPRRCKTCRAIRRLVRLDI